jgi:hypothetical protein
LDCPKEPSLSLPASIQPLAVLMSWNLRRSTCPLFVELIGRSASFFAVFCSMPEVIMM